MNSLNQTFTSIATPSGVVTEYDSGTRGFAWQDERPTVMELLSSAVHDVRQFWVERGLHAGVKAARDGVSGVVDYIVKGGRFATGRDVDGLDAGYYVARYCTPYDFVAVGTVERIGPVARVERLRYYNQHPDGRAAFVAAVEAGLSFTDCADDEGRTAGFYIARCNDAELIALYEQAGGTFRQRELEVLGRVEQARKRA